jgi:hypothetical protein
MHLAQRISALLLLSAAALFACNKLDKNGVEQTVVQSMGGKGHAMKSVICPDGLDFKEQTIDCSGVDSAGKPVAFKITIKPTSGGKADIRYVTTIDGKQFSN